MSIGRLFAVIAFLNKTFKKNKKNMMINRYCKFQGCSSIYMGMAIDLDVPVLLLTLGICVLLFFFCIFSIQSSIVYLPLLAQIWLKSQPHTPHTTSSLSCYTKHSCQSQFFKSLALPKITVSFRSTTYVLDIAEFSTIFSLLLPYMYPFYHLWYCYIFHFIVIKDL